MGSKSIKSVDFEKILKNNNYILKRSSGDHKIYYNEGYHISITYPYINKTVVLRLIKTHQLKVVPGELPGIRIHSK